MSATHPFWITVFLDFAPHDFERGVEFWAEVSGCRVSPRRGDEAEFVTLVPHAGDDVLRVQQLREGPGRLHLDLHVADPDAAATEAVALGADVVTRHRHGFSVLRSPGGLRFCFVTQSASRPPRARTWPGHHRSLVDQVCLDIPPAVHAAEVAFWVALTGRELRQLPSNPEFALLPPPQGQPVRLLLQRLGEGDEVRAHLDLATTDRTAEIGRHVGLGARVVREHDSWTVLADPAGVEYCLTDRTPPRVDPPLVAGETEMLLAWLDYHRDTLRLKTSGLTAQQLAATLDPSTMTLGGMLKHLALVEDYWFSVILMGNDDAAPWNSADWNADRDWEWHSAVDDDPDDLRRLFDESVAASDVILGQVLAHDGPDRLSVTESRRGNGRFSLRWILVHMIEEYARHNGHADLIRESIDGSTGE